MFIHIKHSKSFLKLILNIEILRLYFEMLSTIAFLTIV